MPPGRFEGATILRRGKVVATCTPREKSARELAELMVGRKVLLRVDKAQAAPGAPVLELAGVEAFANAVIAYEPVW